MIFEMFKSPVELIKKDHRTVEKLFKEYEAEDGDKKSIADKIGKELTVHAEMEEKYFYPEMRKISSEADSLISEAVVEHNEIKKHITESKPLEDGPELDKHVNMTKESVMHHVQEEESKVLPMAEEKMRDKFPDMTKKMLEFKTSQKM